MLSPRDVRLHLAGIIVDEVERAILDAQPEAYRSMRRTAMSQKRAAASEAEMPNLWLSLCGVLLRDPDYGLFTRSTSEEQRIYVDIVSEACFCLHAEKPDQATVLLNQLQMTVNRPHPGDNVCACVWEIAHSLRVALHLAARCELGEPDANGTVCVFPIVSSVGMTALRPTGPVDLLAKLASAAIIHAMKTCGELVGWIAFETDAVDLAERMAAKEGGHRHVANSLFKQYVRLLSRC